VPLQGGPVATYRRLDTDVSVSAKGVSRREGEKMASGAAPAQNPTPATEPAEKKLPAASDRWAWLKYVTPIAILLIAALIVVTLTRDWNAWEGGKPEQVTDDAYVRGDLTPLSTRVPGIVSRVTVSDYQKVRAGDLLVELEDSDYRAQVAQATAAVEAAKAAIGNNREQQKLQDAKIQRALAGIDLAKAQIAAAQAGVQAVQADVTRTRAERTRQEALIAAKSTTQQQLEVAVADQERFAAMEASRSADLEQAKSALQENEIAVEAERRAKDVLQSQALQFDADLQAKVAALSVAQINLDYTKIHAPADGIVGERQVRPGQLLSPGAQILTFVAETKWIQANYRETQLTHMKVGDPAEIKVDLFPGQIFRGKVSQIAPASGSQFALLPPDNATGNFTKVTQRVPVKIIFDDPASAAALQPGLSVVTTVHIK
jgi:membrane fusion protein, multidrug efflux system